MRGRRSADGDLADALGGEDSGDARAQIALQHDRLAVDCAAAAERLLELAAPRLELLFGEAQLLDDSDLLAAAALALHANDGARDLGARRCCRRVAARFARRQRAAQGFE